MKTQDRTKHENRTLINQHKAFIIQETEGNIDSAITAQFLNIVRMLINTTGNI